MPSKVPKSALKGRPNNIEKPKIREELLKHFMNGHSPVFAHLQTGHHLRTVYNYYKEFQEELAEDITSDFVVRQKASKEIVLAGLDKDLTRMEMELERISELCADEPDNSEWARLYQSLLKSISEVRQQKADIEMSPTIDVSLEDIAEHYLGDKDEKEPSSSTTIKK